MHRKDKKTTCGVLPKQTRREYVAAEINGARRYTRLSYFPRERWVTEPFDRNEFGQLVPTGRKGQGFSFFLVLIRSVVNKKHFFWLLLLLLEGALNNVCDVYRHAGYRRNNKRRHFKNAFSHTETDLIVDLQANFDALTFGGFWSGRHFTVRLYGFKG